MLSQNSMGRKTKMSSGERNRLESLAQDNYVFVGGRDFSYGQQRNIEIPKYNCSIKMKS